MKRVSFPGRDAPPGDGAKPALLFLLIFILLAEGIVTVGYLSFKSHERQYFSEAERQLTAITELKAGEITRWREARRADGLIFFKNRTFSDLARRFLEKPEDAEAQRQLLDWLSAFPAHHGYDRIRLLDTQGVSRLSVPAKLPPISSFFVREISEVLRTGQVTFQDFYRNEYDHRIYLAVLVPIFDEADGNRPLGMILLRIDPATYLYPFLQRWPVPSATAETLIVRREGNEAVFLNELRFQTNTALNLRAPFTRVDLPAVQAAMGKKGSMRGIDYRGVPVIADTQPIPDSPWSMVARRDIAEVVVEMRARLWQTIAMVGSLIFCAAACVGMIWRHQRVGFYREKANAAEALRESEHKLKQAQEVARLGNYELDVRAGNWTSSEMLDNLFGIDASYPRNIASWSQLVHPDDRKDTLAYFLNHVVMGRQPFDREYRIVRVSDGAVRWVHGLGQIRCNDAGEVIEMFGVIQDITERKQAEMALRERETQLRVTLESTADGILAVDNKGKVIQANRRFLELWRIPPSLAERRDDQALLDFVLSQLSDPEAFRRKVQSLYDSDAESMDTFAFKDGRVFERYSKPMISDDALVGRVWSFRDVTERKQAEDALRVSEERFRLAIVDSPFPILLHAEDGAVLQASNAWCEITGYTREELATIGDWTERAYGTRKALVQADIDALYGLDRRKYEGDYTIRTKTGDMRIWEFSSAPLGRLPDGRRLVVSMAMDVTERRRMTAALSREQEFQRALLDNLADGVVACDAQGKLILFNQVAREWHGMDPLAIPPEEWGEHYNLYGPDGITPLPAESVPLLRSFRGETVRDAEMTIVAKGQPSRYILAASCPFFDAQRNLLGAVAVMRDITQRKQAESNMVAMMKNLRASNQDLEQFAYVASHDMQEPLRMVSNYMQLLKKRYQDKLDPEADEFIGYAVDGAVRMKQLIDSLLEYSRVQSRQKPFEPVDLNQVLSRVLRDLEGRVLETGANITAGPLPQVIGDALQLGLVFQNLIGNALKFSGDKSPEAHIAAEELSKHWKITVRDNGIGIEPQYQDRIFKIFQRLHSRSEYPGTGIGLAVCRRVIERHGGETGVESEFGKGSSFWFTLPKKGEK